MGPQFRKLPKHVSVSVLAEHRGPVYDRSLGVLGAVAALLQCVQGLGFRGLGFRGSGV